MHWTSESRLRQLHASCLSATRELLDAFRAHRWLHSVGKTKWLILLRWCTRQTVLDVKVWWPQYTIDYRQLFDFEIARFNAKAGSISSRSGIFCLKKGVWRRCMACISSFLQHFPMSFTWVRGHSWAFRNVPVIEKCGKKCLTPAPLYLLDPFGTPTWTWESSIIWRERHPCNLTDYICNEISQLQLLKGHDCNKSCTSICGAGNDVLCYSHVPVLKVHIKPTQGSHAGGLSVKALGNCTKKHSQHSKWMPFNSYNWLLSWNITSVTGVISSHV